jgi:hypothetical protein
MKYMIYLKNTADLFDRELEIVVNISNLNKMMKSSVLNFEYEDKNIILPVANIIGVVKLES